MTTIRNLGRYSCGGRLISGDTHSVWAATMDGQTDRRTPKETCEQQIDFPGPECVVHSQQFRKTDQSDVCSERTVLSTTKQSSVVGYIQPCDITSFGHVWRI
ncbi:unnamed protein product [Boreogadus saida]